MGQPPTLPQTFSSYKYKTTTPYKHSAQTNALNWLPLFTGRCGVSPQGKRRIPNCQLRLRLTGFHLGISSWGGEAHGSHGHGKGRVVIGNILGGKLGQFGGGGGGGGKLSCLGGKLHPP